MITIQVFGGASFEFDGIPKQGISHLDRSQKSVYDDISEGWFFVF